MARAEPVVKQALWLRLLAALGVIVVGVTAAMQVSLMLPAVIGGFEPVGVALLLTAIVGLATCVLLYRVARGDMLARRSVQALAAGVLISLGGTLTAYTLLIQSFERHHLRDMKSHLRILAGMQEEYFRKHGRFAGDTALLYTEPRYRSNIVVTVEHADDLSWRARATNAGATKRVCRATGNRTTAIYDPVCD